MKKRLNQKNKEISTNDVNGFTIVELLVVMVIVGILAAITVVSYVGITGKAREASVASDLKNGSDQVKLYYAENGKYPAGYDNNNCPKNEYGEVSTSYCLKTSPGNAPLYRSIPPYLSYSFDISGGGILYRNTDSTGQVAVSTFGSFAKTWGGSGVEDAYSIFQTQDGGFVTTGSTTSFGAGGVDMYISKYNAAGDLAWNKTWGGTGSDVARDVVQTSDGRYIITGQTSSYGAGSSDVFLVKFDENGNIVWSKTWGGVNGDYSRSITSTSDGGVAVTGYTNNFDAGISDLFLSKYDSDGNLSWVKVWGSADIEYGRDLYQTSDGGYLVSGLTKSFGNGGEDALLVKFDSSGNFVWNKTWGGASDDVGYGLTWSNDGGCIMTGYTRSYGAGSLDSYIAKFDSNGGLVWSSTWGGSSAEEGRSVIQTSDGGYVVTGYTDSYAVGSHDMSILKYNSNGVLLWNKTWGISGSDRVNASHNVIQTGDGGFVSLGNTDSYGVGNDDAFIIKFKPDGAVNNCLSPTCKSPAASVSSPSVVLTTPVATVNGASPTVNSPSATVTSPSATMTTIFNP